MGLQVVAPVRCPRCRSRLTSTKLWRTFGRNVRWCNKCERTVAYDDHADGWQWITPMVEDPAP